MSVMHVSFLSTIVGGCVSSSLASLVTILACPWGEGSQNYVELVELSRLYSIAGELWEGRKVPTKSLFEQEAPKIGTQRICPE